MAFLSTSSESIPTASPAESSGLIVALCLSPRTKDTPISLVARPLTSSSEGNLSQKKVTVVEAQEEKCQMDPELQAWLTKYKIDPNSLTGAVAQMSLEKVKEILDDTIKPLPKDFMGAKDLADTLFKKYRDQGDQDKKMAYFYIEGAFEHREYYEWCYQQAYRLP